MTFSLWKQVKRRLRRRRRPLWTLGTFLIGVFAAALWYSSIAYSAELHQPAAMNDNIESFDELQEVWKKNAFFGLDKLGNLSLFDGPPADEKVIRTFFQLDVTYMESSLPKEQIDSLNRGIPVNDLAEYNSVLSTFSEFAYQPSSEKVMKPAY
ncbi:BofC C-terminal domain-containing protein [Paenibacillus tarimensis]